jgi:hypothetical protein
MHEPLNNFCQSGYLPRLTGLNEQSQAHVEDDRLLAVLRDQVPLNTAPVIMEPVVGDADPPIY